MHAWHVFACWKCKRGGAQLQGCCVRRRSQRSATRPDQACTYAKPEPANRTKLPRPSQLWGNQAVAMVCDAREPGRCHVSGWAAKGVGGRASRIALEHTSYLHASSMSIPCALSPRPGPRSCTLTLPLQFSVSLPSPGMHGGQLGSSPRCLHRVQLGPADLALWEGEWMLPCLFDSRVATRCSHPRSGRSGGHS